MRCPNCGGDTPPNLRYCEVCGSPLDLSFSKVSEALHQEQEERRLKAIELQARQGMLLGLVILLIALTVALTAPAVPEPRIHASHRSGVAVDLPLDEAIPQERIPVTVPLDR